MQIINYDQVMSKIIEIREQRVILDSDVGELYGLETKRINEAVKNNPDKFPQGYILNLTKDEWESVRSKFSTSPLGGGKVRVPKAFTEKGLYMLATILKSTKAIGTTIAIIDTFTQLRQLTQAVYKFSSAKAEQDKIEIFEEATEIVAELLDNELIVSQKETEIKIKLPFFELTRKITKVKK